MPSVPGSTAMICSRLTTCPLAVTARTAVTVSAIPSPIQSSAASPEMFVNGTTENVPSDSAPVPLVAPSEVCPVGADCTPAAAPAGTAASNTTKSETATRQNMDMWR